MLDAGCGSGRLTVALAQAGATVTGFDTSAERLEQARRRAAERGVDLCLLEADFNERLPFAAESFDAVTSRLSLMAADDPVATLRELGRVLAPGGRLATALWASPAENPWFSEPRAAVATTLGAERGAFARAFGRLGHPAEAAEAHRRAGFHDVETRVVAGQVEAPSALEHWGWMAARIGHFQRLDAELTSAERELVVSELSSRLERFRAGDRVALPRVQTLVAARRWRR